MPPARAPSWKRATGAGPGAASVLSLLGALTGIGGARALAQPAPPAASGAALPAPPAPAAAGPAAAPSPGEAAAYKQHMDNGIKLYNSAAYAAAIVEFRAAYERKPSPGPLIDIALCQRDQHNYPRAIEALEKALALHGEAMSPTDRAAAEDAIRDMRGLLAYFALKITPPNAHLTIDGEEPPAETPEHLLPLGPGKHTLALQAEGFAALSQDLTVASGDKGEVLLKMTPDKGYVTIEGADAKMALAIDRQPVGFGSWHGLLTPGTHFVQMYRPGTAQSSYDVDVVVVAGQVQDIRPGVGGIPANGAPQPLIPVPPGPPLPKKEEPPRRGFYGLVSASFLAPYTHPTGFSPSGTNVGGAGGARVGYRVNNPAAFELQFQYANMFTASQAPASAGTQGGYTWGSTRFALDLRLMTTGRVVRFYGDIGGGFSLDTVTFAATTPNCQPMSPCTNASGGAPLLLAELGLELELAPVLIDLNLETHYESSRGIASNGADVFDNAAIGDIGGGIRIGLANW